LGVVAAVGEERVGAAAWSSALATQRWDRLDERQQLGDVGAVGAGEQAGEGDTVGVGDQVMLGASLARIPVVSTNRIPFNARRSSSRLRPG
jgi:hypothetical protein